MRRIGIALLLLCGVAAAGETVDVVVEDSEGNPAARAEVHALSPFGVGLRDGEASLLIGQAVTDAEGRATVATTWGDHACFLAFRGRQAVFICHRDVSDGKPVTVRLGPGVAVRGRIISPEGELIEGARARVIMPGGYEMHGVDAEMRKGGIFRFPPLPVELIAGGHAVLEVDRAGYLLERVSLTPTANHTPLEVHLKRPVTLTGTVVDADGGPVGSARVVLINPEDREDPAYFDDNAGVRTRGDGSFRLPMAPGRAHRLFILPLNHAPRMLPVFAATESVELGKLPVKVGKPIAGVVRDSDGRGIIYGFAALEDATGFRVGRATLGPGGKFTFLHVGEGEYGLTVWVHRMEGVGGSRELRRFGLKAGGEALDIVLPAGFRIRFVDADGKPVTVYQCSATIGAAGWNRPWEVSEYHEEGMTELVLQPGGPRGLRFTLRAQGFLPVKGIRGEVAADGTGDVAVRLVRDPKVPLRRSPSHASTEAEPEEPAGDLARIELPENPSKDDVRTYIEAIFATVGKRSTFSTTDPEVGMLRSVGPEHVDVLIEFYGRPFTPSAYVEWALDRLVTADDKELILEELQTCERLVKFVVEHGWAEDARETLLGAMINDPTFLPTAWIDAVAALKDPETYPLLLAYLGQGSNPSWTYRSICDLPGIHLTEAVARAWARCRRGSTERQYFAAIATAFGHVDALAVCVESLDPELDDQRRVRRAAEIVRRHLEFAGTDEELRAWFSENREKLVFDPATKMYRVGE
jgi:hypothetical protein